MIEWTRHPGNISEDNFTNRKIIVYHQPMELPAGSKGKIVDYIEKCIIEQNLNSPI